MKTLTAALAVLIAFSVSGCGFLPDINFSSHNENDDHSHGDGGDSGDTGGDSGGGEPNRANCLTVDCLTVEILGVPQGFVFNDGDCTTFQLSSRGGLGSKVWFWAADGRGDVTTQAETGGQSFQVCFEDHPSFSYTVTVTLTGTDGCIREGFNSCDFAFDLTSFVVIQSPPPEPVP